MTLIAANSLKGYVELVEELGGTPSRLLEGAGISEVTLKEPDGEISFASSIQLLEDTAAELDCSDFGLRLAERQHETIPGPVAVAVQNSRTLGEALKIASSYSQILVPGVVFSLTEAENGRPKLIVELALRGVGFAVQDTEQCFALMVRAIEEMTGRGVDAVCFKHPRNSKPSVYQRHFRCPVHFDCSESSVLFEPGGLDRPIYRAQGMLREMAETYLRTQDNPGLSTAGRVRIAITRALGTGSSSFETIAGSMAVHPRTLQRKLKDENTTFEAIKDEVRQSLAREYLANAQLSMGQVASRLDYREQSALTRSCRRWFGKPPSEVRLELTSR
ncbi:MAG: AraC family transcriptional regulator [Myxococcota bacterium]